MEGKRVSVFVISNVLARSISQVYAAIVPLGLVPLYRSRGLRIYPSNLIWIIPA